MKRLPRAIVMAALFAVSTAPLLAETSPEQARASQAAHAVPDHSVSGVVKFVDRTRLVITRARAGKIPVESTFTVNASTLREGLIAVGAKVQVRFRDDGHSAIATAILAIPQPAPARHDH